MCTICQSARYIENGGAVEAIPGSFQSFVQPSAVNSSLSLGASESGDAAGNSNTNASMNIGETFDGNISSASDQDWIQVELVAGQSYTFNVWGTGGSNAGITDTTLNVRNSSGTSIAANDDLELNTNRFSGVEFSATTSGTYYLDVGGFSDFTGNYTLQASTDIWSPEEAANWLTEVSWGVPTDIHFDVSAGGSLSVNLTGLNEGGDLARFALQAWTDVTGITFNEVSSGAQIEFSESGSGQSAFAGPTSFNPANGIISTSSVTVTTGWLDRYGTTIDSYSFLTYVHEIGHALGLGHLGPYDGGASYGSNNFFTNDSIQMSVMSYFDEDNTFVGMTDLEIITPMIADIIAVERLYGAHEANTGNTVWGANSNVSGFLGDVFGEYFDGDNTGSYNGGAIGFTVQDDGGRDLLDFSTAQVDQVIRLGQGRVSDINGEIGNVVIADGSVIEDASSGSGNDRVFGNGSNNELRSGTGADTVVGGGGNDRIYAEGAGSSLYGNNGDDFLRNDVGQTYFSGGAGNDTVAYFRRDSGVNVNLETGANNTGSTYNSIENLIGTASHSDTLTGDNGNNSLLGSGGNDRISGGRGNDTLGGGSGNDRLSDASGADTFNGGSGNDTASYFDHQSGVRVNLGTGSNSSGDTYISIENVMGSNAASDSLRGDDDNNRLRGFGDDDRLFGDRGNDTLEGGAGDDYLRDESGADTFIGGSGIDIVSYYGRVSNLRVNLETGSNNSGDTYDGIEGLMGGNVGNDDLTGSSSSNRLWGFGGNDEIDGGAGNDSIEGGDGNDSLTGGSGTDRFIFERNDDDDIITDFQNGTDRIVFDITGLDFGDLSITNVSGGARITYDNDDTIFVAGISSNQLTNADFDFV